MKKIIAIAGTNSQKSINTRLLAYASGLMENVELTTINLNDYVLPMYGVDFEDDNGIPETVKKLNGLFEKADGFIISLAEHNGTYTAVFKNTLDWLTRVNIKVWREKPVLLLATSPGERGGATVLQGAVNYFPFIGANIIGDFSLPSFYDNFSEDGILNKDLQTELVQKVNRLEHSLNAE